MFIRFLDYADAQKIRWGGGENAETARAEESRSRFVIHIRVSEDKAIKSPRASGCGADSPAGLPRRIKLTDPPGTQRDEQIRRDRGEYKGEEAETRLSDQMKGKYCIFYEGSPGRLVWADEGNSCGEGRSRWIVTGRWDGGGGERSLLKRRSKFWNVFAWFAKRKGFSECFITPRQGLSTVLKEPVVAQSVASFNENVNPRASVRWSIGFRL